MELAFELPKLTIEVTSGKDLNEGKIAGLKTTIETRERFRLMGDLKISYNTHLGWEVGPQASVSVKNHSDKKIISRGNWAREAGRK